MTKQKQCPHCKEMKRADATTCPQCGQAEIGLGTFLIALVFVSPLLLCLGLIIMSTLR